MDGLRRPQQARAVRTRLSLLDAARAEFSEHGYAGTTSRSIAKRAGVSTGTFYQYFVDKNAVLHELGAQYLQRAAEVSLGVLETVAPIHLDAFDLEGELRRRFRQLCAASLLFRRSELGLQRVFRQRRCADAQLQTQWLADERGVLDRITALLDLWRIRSSAARALVLYGMVDGAIEALVEHSADDDERALDILVEALVHVVVPHSKENAA